MNSVPKSKVQDGGDDFLEKHSMNRQSQYQDQVGFKLLNSIPNPTKQHYYAEKRKLVPVPVTAGEKENETKLYKSARIDDRLKKKALAAEQAIKDDKDNLKRQNHNGGGIPLERIKELKVLVEQLETEINGFYWEDRRQEREYLKLDGKLSIYLHQLRKIKVPENKLMKPTREKASLLHVLTQLQDKLYGHSNVPVHFLGNYEYFNNLN